MVIPIISFETAKVLKGKWKEHEDVYYWKDNKGIVRKQGGGAVSCLRKDLQDEYYPAPVAEDVIRWLRENKDIFITIGFCDYPVLHKSTWMPEICTHDSFFDEPTIEYDSYDEACEQAIKYVFEKLI
jgi:hypothetical protein